MDASALVYSYPSQTPRYDAATSAAASLSGGLPTAADAAASGGQISFKDMIDTINPLQQLPIIGTLYRAITGDTLSAGSQMLGGALFGGPAGLVASAINAGLKAASGGDIGDHLLAMFDSGAPATTQLAAAKYAATQNLG